MAFRAALVLLLLCPRGTAIAQATDSVPASRPPDRLTAPPIRLWHLGAAIGGVALVSLADNDVQHWVVDHRTQGEQDLAKTWQRLGEGTVPVSIALGSIAVGLVVRRPAITRTGERVATSLVIATLIGRGMKKAVGRSRPSEAGDQYQFDPFGDPNAFPSGHTLTAFALSATLADAVDNQWADVGLYTLAAGTGVSRLVGNHHWLSDVVGGALLGTTVAKVVDGKWRIFSLRPPAFLTGPEGARFQWDADLPALRR